MTQRMNRQWLLAARPKGLVKESDFRRHDTAVPEISDGEILVRSTHVSIDPAMRGWMENRGDYMAPLDLGDVMRSFNVGDVVASRNPAYREGDVVTGLFGWQDYCVAGTKACPATKLARPEMRTLYLGGLGVTGFTAYFGLLDLGEPKEGQTVVVSGAAGAVGSVAGQIARIKGCRVVGIAGGAEKCRWVVEDLGFDACIDYKAEDVGKRMTALCPEGINIYFDNVGGEILDHALARLAMHGRVVLCGGISRYNDLDNLTGPKNYFNLIFRRARMEGFIVLDYADRYSEAEQHLARWIETKELTHRETIVEGFDNLPAALIGLFKGQNIGKQIVHIGD
ncbi:MAG: NADP-dependent oxidoreductase [Alphaproteobacteria bacterium]|nr:MAG: NADP-dependent oxidoreductase [Alphaproteobacteria bacterium]